jgi:hypothetical protein
LRKKVTSKKTKKRRDDVAYQLNRVGQNKVPEMGQLSLPKPKAKSNIVDAAVVQKAVQICGEALQ